MSALRIELGQESIILFARAVPLREKAVLQGCCICKVTIYRKLTFFQRYIMALRCLLTFNIFT
jgi:hypothetical protein